MLVEQNPPSNWSSVRSGRNVSLLTELVEVLLNRFYQHDAPPELTRGFVTPSFLKIRP